MVSLFQHMICIIGPQQWEAPTQPALNNWMAHSTQASLNWLYMALNILMVDRFTATVVQATSAVLTCPYQ